ncbi:hypothetical protein HMPREF1977_0834 [Capnocytophaga ochracea F0287]|uniref:Uncharacterized protein n=1 Tax=Capnocytophaga ochracea F0287 TaxID=873517 RepID=E4MR24_CAPOC|nr:hypothetical protein [Capnocytophaga ochracea]EFS97922.1 hypothetical protein HMPREF1977_0834 [Capnocytophaga ochracea F0287]UEB43832.1 hypothetical protein LK419_02295 [Capnocytophaga ochracea]
MNEQKTVRAARANERMTNNERTMNEAKLKLRQSYNLRKLNTNCFFKVIKLWKKRNDFRVFMIFRLQ